MPDTKLPSDSPSESSAKAAPLRLKDRVPPKPARRGKAIPRALVVSTTATKIPPAPRPPKPQAVLAKPQAVPGSSESRRRPASSAPKPPPAQDWALDPQSERQTMGPVSAAVSPGPRRRGVTSPLIGLLAVGVVASGSWFLHERSSARQNASPGVADAVDANASRPTLAPKLAPADQTGAIPTVHVHEDSGTAERAAPSDAVPNDLAVPNHQQPSNTAPGKFKTPKAEQATLARMSEPGEPPKAAAPEAPTTPSADVLGTNAETTTPTADSAAATQLSPFDAHAAKSALTAGALAASSCRKGDDPRGTAEVIVTFAPSGRITSANVNGAPYGGTATGGCVAATLRRATVPPFAGQHVTVRKLVTIR